MTAPSKDAAHRASNLPDLAEEGSADGERISVTDVNGTVARFEMSYSPVEGDRFAFGPPLRMRLPSFLYLGFALFLLALVSAAHASPSNSRLYIWIVEGDRNRPLGAGILAFIVLVSALATVVRAHMRGVIVRMDGIEARYILSLGMPKIKRWAWPQVDRFVIDDTQVMLELWDGTYERLPEVADTAKLTNLLERIAAGRRIHVTKLKNAAGS
ncbi:MAG: hypothetical protein ABIP39_00675 [Polyangiaceae bacterium]